MILPYGVAERLLHVLPLRPGKLRESLEGRREAGARWEQWAAANRARDPLIWVHAASVGEALAAEPIVKRLKALPAHPIVVHTHTSPSMARWPRLLSADATGYAPGEWANALRRTFDALRPSLLVFTRGDIWPGLVAEASGRSIPMAVAGASTGAKTRLSTASGLALRSTHRRIAWVGACSSEDAARWTRLGVPEPRITVTGDPRDDYTLERNADLQSAAPLLEWSAGRPLLVAGSTHKPDEHVLIHALAGLPRDVRLIVAPHEPSPKASAAVGATAQNLGLKVTPWSGGTPEGDPNVLVVERMGLLSDLYAAGSVAYVGGGFRRGALHAVAEPAAYALPIVAGPFAADGGDGARFASSGGLTTITQRDSVSDLRRVWHGWIQNPDARWAAGLRARATLSEGAADRTLAALEGLLMGEQIQADQRS